MSEKLMITKRTNMKGYDGYKVFSVRIKEDIVAKLDDISVKTNRSRNEVINIMLDYGTQNCSINDESNT
ncbi:MAG: CopG family transcriptional regulator [Oscillospiraceae bacterium]|nr:CopG family transcriptional regulator [Oscillospiraceae bacterium]